MSETQPINPTAGLESLAEQQEVPDVFGAADWNPAGLISPTVAVSVHYAPKRKASAFFWLTFFFGNLGVGRFYMGHLGLGFAYMFTLGFFLIGPIVDLFICRKVARKENTQRGYGPVTK